MKNRQPKRIASFCLGVAGVITVGALAAMAVASAQTTPEAPSLSELLETALYTEETLGDLDAAIGIYQEILARAETERSYVAKAQFRLAMCYYKKGRQDEAIAAFQKIVSDFPKQAALVTQAQALLADLGVQREKPGVLIRQVWGDAGEMNGAPSPDGRYLTFTDWSTGDLALHDFETGRDRHLTSKGSWATDSYAEFSIFSPDGKQVAYSWFAGEPVYELRVINVDGSGERTLYGKQGTNWLQPLDWSSDGNHILAWLAKDPEDLALISVEDGSVRVVGEPNERWWGKKIALSRAGELVAFSRLQAEGARKHDVFLLSVDDGKEHRLIEHPADDLFLGWSPQGDHLLFASDRTGDFGVWAIRVTQGTANGSPELVKSSFGDVLGQIWPMEFTDRGSFFYGVRAIFSDVYQAPFDGDSGLGKAAATKITKRFEGSNSQPEWSADGKHVAWLSEREGSYALVMKELDTGDEREVSVSPRMIQIGRFQGARWSPDASSFLVAGRAHGQEGWWGIFSIDGETGDITQLAQADPNGIVRNALWSADGKAVYFERRAAKGGGSIVAVDLATGEERVVYPRHAGNMAISPDGKHLAFTTDSFNSDVTHLLRVVPTAGGQATEIFRSHDSEPFHSLTPLAWLPDNRHLIFGTGDFSGAPGSGSKMELWKIAIDGGEPESLGPAISQMAHLRVHPNGQWIVFDAGARKAEVWAAENILPALQASQ